MLPKHITSRHQTDKFGNPAGGTTTGLGLSIQWQDGPLRENGEVREPNGAFVEHVLEAAIDRLQYYQGSKFKCRENALAITHAEEALHWLNARTADREERGVEGTHST